MYNEKKNGRPGLMEASWEAAGVNCEVLKGGTLRQGDEARVVPHSFMPERIDGGVRPAGFFMPPSQRTAQQVPTLPDY